jgi:hypothetical protein
MNVVVAHWLHLRCKLVAFSDLVLDNHNPHLLITDDKKQGVAIEAMDYCSKDGKVMYK